jgi:type II secretory pathway component GspD/PulD (secretin)
MKLQHPVVFLLPLLLSACLTAPPDNRDLDSLLDAYRAQSNRLAERQQAYRGRGIRQLQAVPDPQRSGEFRVSADLDNAGLAVVMERLVQQTGLDYNLGDTRLAERVSARFHDRPLKEALSILLAPAGYKATVSGGVINIVHGTLPRTEKQQGSALQSEMPLKYIDTEFAKEFLESLYPPDRSGDKITYAMNPARNSVFLSGDAGTVRTAVKQLEQADTDSGHVLIEVLAVEFNTEAFREVGARIFDAARGKFSDVNIDLGALAGGSIGFTHIADADNVTQLSAVLNLLIEDQAARVISRPYVATLSNKPASLEITEDRYVTIQTASGLDASLEKVATGVEMEITPIVQADGLIRLTVDLTESKFLGGADNTGLRTNRNNVQTTLRMGDGETVVIGGLMLNAYSYADTGLPGLRDIPAAGSLFGHKDHARVRRQVMLYITPHLWTPGTETPLLHKDEFSGVRPGDKPAPGPAESATE